METKSSSQNTSYMNQTFENICDNLTEDEIPVFQAMQQSCKQLRELKIATSETKDMYDKTGPEDCSFLFVAGGWVRDKVRFGLK